MDETKGNVKFSAPQNIDNNKEALKGSCMN